MLEKVHHIVLLSAGAVVGCTAGPSGLDPAALGPASPPAAAAPATPEPSTPEPSSPAPATPSEVPPDLATCELSVVDAGAGSGHYGPATIEFDARGVFMMVSGSWSGSVRAASDSRALGELQGLRDLDVDAQIGLREAPQDEAGSHLELVDLTAAASEDTLGTIDWPVDDGDPTTYGWLGGAALWQSPMGLRVVAVGCQAYDAAEARLSVWTTDVPPEPMLDITLPMPCDGGMRWPGRPVLALTEGHAIVTFGADRLVSADLVTGGTAAIGLPADVAVMATAVDRAADRVVVSTSDGQLRVFRAHDLSTVSLVTTGVGFVTANPYTYATSIESPVAVSPDGRWIAHLDEGFNPETAWVPPEPMVATGHITIRDTATLSVVRSLDVPLAGPESWNNTGQGSPVGLAFTPDGQGLVAALDIGLRTWRCGAASTATADGLSVKAAWPKALAQQDTLTVDATAFEDGLPAAGPILYTLWWGEAPTVAAGSSFSGVITVPTYIQAGLTEIRFRLTATDGVREAETWATLPLASVD